MICSTKFICERLSADIFNEIKSNLQVEPIGHQLMELILAYFAGILTLINPCVLPVLPIVLASSLQSARRGPLYLALGMMISFVSFGMFVTTIGYTIGLTQEVLAEIGAVMMILFGLTLLTPAIASRFEMATQTIAGSANNKMLRLDMSGEGGQLIGGLLLGAVWSPCIGPTLGGAIALASQGQSLFWAFLIMLSFSLGVSSFIIGISLGAQNQIRHRTHALKFLAERSKPIMGVVFLSVGLMIYFKIHHVIEAWAIEHLPYWFQDLSIMF